MEGTGHVGDGFLLGFKAQKEMGGRERGKRDREGRKGGEGGREVEKEEGRKKEREREKEEGRKRRKKKKGMERK